MPGSRVKPTADPPALLLAVKPLLRGWSHGLAALAAAAGAVVLITASVGDTVKLLAVGVYGASLVVLLGFSAIYHIPNWSPATRATLRRIDHANIFLLIAGTYTPVIAILLQGVWRVSTLIAIWAVAIAGMAIQSPAIRTRRRLVAGIYVGMGWIAVVVFPQLVSAVGWAVLLLLLGGVLYSFGALAYAVKRPNPWPRVFGYHEIFHLAVIAASVAFYVFVATIVVPRR